jgi:peptide deformylase
MGIYRLIESESPLLTIPLSGCSKDLDRKELKENLIETMQNLTGIGLSASQCGIMERVFVMYSDVKKKEILTCFNPKIISVSEEKIFMDEGCLTYPGLWLRVKRPEGIEVSYEDENGEIHEKALFGLEARIFLHEYDHMEGTNFTKKVSRLRLGIAKKRLKKVKRKAARDSYSLVNNG